MKFISVAILLMCMFAATFSDVCMIASYKINQQYISKTLCINKDKPAMHCNGRCYLSKQLAKADKPASPLNTKNNQRFQIQFCNAITELTFNANLAQSINFSHNQQFIAQEYSALNLRPPQA